MLLLLCLRASRLQLSQEAKHRGNERRIARQLFVFIFSAAFELCTYLERPSRRRALEQGRHNQECTVRTDLVTAPQAHSAVTHLCIVVVVVVFVVFVATVAVAVVAAAVVELTCW